MGRLEFVFGPSLLDPFWVRAYNSVITIEWQCNQMIITSTTGKEWLNVICYSWTILGAFVYQAIMDYGSGSRIPLV